MRLDAVPVYYFTRIPNVGDLVNPHLIGRIANHPTKLQADRSKPHLLAVGSLLSASTRQSLVWGTGAMHASSNLGDAFSENIFALRGKLTHGLFRQQARGLPDMPLGDPGYLVPAALGVRHAPGQDLRIGLASHYVDRRHPMVLHLISHPNIVDLNVHESPVKFIEKMATCNAVLSSSLHGLIFSEALGIPNLWVKFSDDIAGDGFKFRDWFSTTIAPEHQAYEPALDDNIEGLLSRASLHGSLIDPGELASAFPIDRLDQILLRQAVGEATVEQERAAPIASFLISYNRGDMLLRSIEGLKRQSRAVDIVVQDNGSSDERTLAVLTKLESDGIKVLRKGAIENADQLNDIDDFISEYFLSWREPQRYIVSDCDIDISISALWMIELFEDFLNENRQIECVGPMLRIRDIPIDYPLFSQVMNRHIEQFWYRIPKIRQTRYGEIPYIDHVEIDTTLALHRANEPFRRLKNAVRTYEPCEALHLDWYTHASDDDPYFNTAKSSISHWNCRDETSRFKDVQLNFTGFNVARQTLDGRAEVYGMLVGTRSDAQAEPPLAGFDLADTTSRSARIQWVESLRASCGGERTRWSSSLSHQPAWAARASMLAGLVVPGERVFEFGAGRSALPRYLPIQSRYVGSDKHPLASGVLYYDLNGPILEPLIGNDTAVFSGVLEYVHDLPRLQKFLAEQFSAVICSYAARQGNLPSELERRRYSGWFNDLSNDEFIESFANAGFELARHVYWETQGVFRFQQRPLKPHVKMLM